MHVKCVNTMSACRTRKEIDAVEVDESILEDQIVVHGSYRKPEVSELAIVQVWLLPYYAYKAIRWQVEWIYRYSIRKQDYSQVCMRHMRFLVMRFLEM